MDQLAATDPDGLFTPNALAAHLRELTNGRTNIGPKTIRAAIHCGDLQASRLGKRWLRVRWVDFIVWVDSKRVEPEPSVTDRVERRVKMQIHREGQLK
jgi:hypothetical protein